MEGGVGTRAADDADVAVTPSSDTSGTTRRATPTMYVRTRRSIVRIVYTDTASWVSTEDRVASNCTASANDWANSIILADDEADDVDVEVVEV